MFHPRRILQPAQAPVSLTEARAHLRYDDTDQDGAIAGLIAAATAHLDGWSGALGRCLVTQTWALDLAGWPCKRHILLPCPDCQAAPSIAYRDADDAAQALASTAWSDPLQHTTGSVVQLFPDVDLPALSPRRIAPVTVTFTVGYGGIDEVPPAIRQAILLMVGDMFRFRESAAPGAFNAIPMSATVEALIAPYRRVLV